MRRGACICVPIVRIRAGRGRWTKGARSGSRLNQGRDSRRCIRLALASLVLLCLGLGQLSCNFFLCPLAVIDESGAAVDRMTEFSAKRAG